MGMQEVFQSAAKTAFNVAGNLRKDVTYISVTDTGLTAKSEASTAIKILFGNFSLLEMNMSEYLYPGDVRGTILTAGFPYTPKKGDKVVHGATTYTVENYDVDPANATYDLHLRTV